MYLFLFLHVKLAHVIYMYIYHKKSYNLVVYTQDSFDRVGALFTRAVLLSGM